MVQSVRAHHLQKTQFNKCDPRTNGARECHTSSKSLTALITTFLSMLNRELSGVVSDNNSEHLKPLEPNNNAMFHIVKTVIISGN